MIRRFRRPLAKTYWALAVGGILVVGGLLGSSVVFAGSEGAMSVADDATVQLRAQEMLGAISVSRAIFSEALVFGAAYQKEDLSETAFRDVLAEADKVLRDLSTQWSSLETVLPDPEIGQALFSYVGAGSRLVADLEMGRFDEAQGIDAVGLREAYEYATRLLVDERDERERHIAAVRAGVGDVADAARFVVAFFVPGLAILAALAFIRHRQRRIQLEAEIERDEEIRDAKDQFLSAVAHELRTPLTAVVGFAETLRDRSRQLSLKDRDELVDILADEASDTAFMIEDLLVFARANIGDLTIRPEVLETGDLIEKIAMGWGGRNEDRLTVSGKGNMWADPLRMKQVFRNLLSNAFDHGGPKVEVRIAPKGSSVEIEVADNGPGIPLALREKVFEPYQHGVSHDGQTAPMGLGLTVARSLVRLMEGDLRYRYRDGESIFEVTIPAATTEQEQQSKRNVRPTQRSGPSPSQIIEAIQQKTLEIVYQPIVDLHHIRSNRRVVGYEALSRFTAGSPPEWFGAAWEAGIGVELELEAIRAAVAGFANAPHRVFLALNVSMETLMSSQLAGSLSGMSPSRIVLELSETTVIDNYQRAKVYLDRLTRRGFRLAFDDLAPGRIDLWYLVRLRPAMVKIDISLVRDIDAEPGKRSLVNGLKWLGEVLKSQIVAEGIERTEELEILTRIGVPYGQGYLLGRPGPLEEPIEHDAGTVAAPVASISG